MFVTGRADLPIEILRNDVGQECRFSRSGHSQDNALHHSNLVRPQPRLAVYVVTEHHGSLPPCFARDALISPGMYDHWWMRPLPLPARACRHEQIARGIESRDRNKK